MDLEAFERVYESFCAFHAVFAPLFGRRECRERGRDYLQGLLVQAAERRNAENMAEVLPVSARVLQRFLTESRWEDAAVITRLQAYLAPRLTHPRAVWAVDSSGFPKQGQQSVGVARQYCGARGKIANCQVGVFLAHVGPRGRALVDKRLFLPQEWTDDPPRCDAAGVPKEQQRYRSETELALEMLQQAKAHGPLVAEWVTGDDAFGKSPSFRAGVAALGYGYVLEIPGDTPVWPVEGTWETPPYRGRGPRPKPRPVVAARHAVRERAALLPQGSGGRSRWRRGRRGPAPIALRWNGCAKRGTASPGGCCGGCIGRTGTGVSRASISPTLPRRRRLRRWRGGLRRAGRSRRSSRPTRAILVWTNTRSAVGRGGITI
jgi:hypothetical protein